MQKPSTSRTRSAPSRTSIRRTKRRAIGKSSRRTGASSRTSTRKISAIGNGPAIESGNANETSRLDGDFSRQSKSQTITDSIKRMFKAAAKALTARDDEQPSTSSKRKRGETDGMPIRLQIAKDHAGKIAARGRYAALKSVRRGAVRLRRAFAASAEDAGLPEVADACDYTNGSTLDWLNLWWNSGADYGAGHGLDDHFSAQQDRNFPQL